MRKVIVNQNNLRDQFEQKRHSSKLLITRLFQETYQLILDDRDLVGFRYISECKYFENGRLI
jgi:hypothetical protein